MRKIGMFFKIERCEMPAIRTLAAVWPAMHASAGDAKSLAMLVERCEPLSLGLSREYPRIWPGLFRLVAPSTG